jgi:hypothetical protein
MIELQKKAEKRRRGRVEIHGNMREVPRNEFGIVREGREDPHVLHRNGLENPEITRRDTKSRDRATVELRDLWRAVD